MIAFSLRSHWMLWCVYHLNARGVCPCLGVQRRREQWFLTLCKSPPVILPTLVVQSFILPVSSTCLKLYTVHLLVILHLATRLPVLSFTPVLLGQQGIWGGVGEGGGGQNTWPSKSLSLVLWSNFCMVKLSRSAWNQGIFLLLIILLNYLVFVQKCRILTPAK